jgi:hypothetical protein
MKSAKTERQEYLKSLKEVMANPHGRRVLYEILEHTSVFSSIWDPSAKIHYNAGRQDVGHWLLMEISEVDEVALATMMQEGYRRKAQKLRESENEEGREDA